MKNHKCSCGSEEVFYDSAKGEYTCSCGKVLEENAVVAEVAFTDSNVQGKFGNQSGDYTQIKCLMGYSKNSRDLRLAKAHKQIQQLASNLNLPNHQAEAAKTLFNLANHRNFTQGRHTSHVVAVAVYIICRLDKTPKLLIDISDCLKVNLYTLGSCYLKFVKELHLESKIPLIDPSLFIHRFCAKLEFGEKAQSVGYTALRLLQRMERDWMSYGRRPNSLCGAAILIAAKYHGFKRTINQIVQIVHACDETIRKRLEEFKKTPVANLTREQFERIDLEKDLKDELDPPSFKRKLGSKEYPEITNFEKELPNYQNELKLHAELIETQLQKRDEDSSISSTIQTPFEESNGPELQQLQITKLLSDKSNQIASIKKSTCEKYSETLSDVDDSDIQQYFLSPEETAIKKILWHHIHKEWIEEQSLKIQSNVEKKAVIKKRKRKPREMIDAPDPITAVSKSKIGGRVDYNQLTNLFDEQIMKKLKTE